MKKYLNNILVKTTLALSIPLSIMFTAPAAQAYDVKSWGGSNCQAYFGSQEGDLNKRADGIYNSASSSRWVSCAVVRDKMFTAPSASGTFAFWVYVVLPANTTAYCRLREASVNGSDVQTRVTNKTNTGWLTLDTSSSHTTGSRTMYCYLPSGGRISHIRSYEYALTDSNS